MIDQNLQGCDGCSLISDFHTQAKLQNSHLYLVSAMITEKETGCANRAGAEGCFQKPLDFDTLAQILASSLQ